MADTPMNTGEVIVELEKGLRIFKALERAHEITLVLATMEQRGLEAERRLVATNRAIAEAEAQGAVRMNAAQANAQAVEDAAATLQRETEAESSRLLQASQTAAAGLVATAETERTRIMNVSAEEARTSESLRAQIAQLREDVQTLETAVKKARQAKDDLLRA
jgi:hypothetical protein